MVQGVGFRYATVRIARRLGLKGFVRNLPDGSVEAVVEGDEAAIQEFQGWIQHGPSLAQVDRVNCQESQVVGYHDFDIRF